MIRVNTRVTGRMSGYYNVFGTVVRVAGEGRRQLYTVQWDNKQLSDHLVTQLYIAEEMEEAHASNKLAPYEIQLVVPEVHEAIPPVLNLLPIPLIEDAIEENRFIFILLCFHVFVIFFRNEMQNDDLLLCHGKQWNATGEIVVNPGTELGEHQFRQSGNASKWHINY